MAFGRKHAVVTDEEKSRYVKVEKKKGALKKSLRTQKEIWIVSALALIWVIVFCYVPMAGNIVAFYQWYPGQSLAKSKFVGLDNFTRFFRTSGL